MFWGQFAEDGDIARYNPHLYNLGEYNNKTVAAFLWGENHVVNPREVAFLDLKPSDKTIIIGLITFYVQLVWMQWLYNVIENKIDSRFLISYVTPIWWPI